MPTKPVVSEGERMPLDPNKTYTIDLKTSEGDFTITLDQKASPKSTASFAALVRKGFFDGTIFHRIVPGFLIQGGDPTGTGTGDPGYTIVDKPHPGRSTPRASSRWPSAATRPPGTVRQPVLRRHRNGDLGLPPDLRACSAASRAGMPVVEKIGKLGDLATERPTKRVVIEQGDADRRLETPAIAASELHRDRLKPVPPL